MSSLYLSLKTPLEELTHRNNAISGDFPRAAKQPAGYPSLTSDMDELKALTKARALESDLPNHRAARGQPR